METKKVEKKTKPYARGTDFVTVDAPEETTEKIEKKRKRDERTDVPDQNATTTYDKFYVQAHPELSFVRYNTGKYRLIGRTSDLGSMATNDYKMQHPELLYERRGYKWRVIGRVEQEESDSPTVEPAATARHRKRRRDKEFAGQCSALLKSSSSAQSSLASASASPDEDDNLLATGDGSTSTLASASTDIPHAGTTKAKRSRPSHPRPAQPLDPEDNPRFTSFVAAYNSAREAKR
ncbi:hypothetical protein LTR15_004721 [Elasticomyces elasticus]|nr:hypothetical protein LTR15_004721 [Elasticomyces elasticus]